MEAGTVDWQGYIDHGSVITPGRWEQLNTLVSLAPAETDEPFLAVDLGCGAGALTLALLRRFPEARALALDASPQMLEHAQANLALYAERVTFNRFDLRDAGWLLELEAVRCFLSSLAIHHLTAAQKQDLFFRLRQKLVPGGALLIADIVAPLNDRVARHFAASWDAAAREQSVALTHQIGPYRWFQDEQWNLFRHPDPEYDRPSPLSDQLLWLREAGFRGVDCFWLRAGHAVYGGFT
ncbi:MAG TPA: methyltransferase domain-containing protein [Chloroflexota bacterium]|nr:methyltransferase domain-containing protein [Chloroflexota bacterium]